MNKIGFSFLCVSILMASQLFSQSFQVTGRNTSSEFLLSDQSLAITFTVTAQNLTTPVIPRLRPESQYESLISCTWTGTEPISPWAGTNDITFLIHLYGDADLCWQSVSFDLLFETGFGPVLATFAGELDTLTIREPFTSLLDQVASENISPFPWPIPFGLLTHPLLHYDIGNLDNPDIRVFLLMDYNLNGLIFSDAFESFFYSISGDCVLDINEDIFSNPAQLYLEDPIFDLTDPGLPVVITPAPLGGGGPLPGDVGQGINIFEITDINLTLCSGTPRQHLNQTPGTYSLSLINNGNNSIIRTMAIYIGRFDTCFTTADNFGPVPSESFRIRDFMISPLGEIYAQLVVPPTWQEDDTRLLSGFRLQWFLQAGTDLLQLGSETRDLILNHQLAQSVLGEAQLEVRVKTVDDEHQVSQTSACLTQSEAIQAIWMDQTAGNWPGTSDILYYLQILARTCPE